MTTRTAQAPATRRSSRTSRTQLRLFEAAMVIMSEKGPTATTVDEVAASAGVSKGTVYYNFGSKKSMVEGLLRYGIKLVMEHVEDAAYGGATSSSGSGAEDDAAARHRLERAVIAGFRFLEEHRGFARLAVAEVWRPGSELSEVLTAQRSALVDQVTGLVEALAEDGPVAPRPDARSIAVALIGALFMLSMDREMTGTRRTAQDTVRAVMLLVDGYGRGEYRGWC